MNTDDYFLFSEMRNGSFSLSTQSFASNYALSSNSDQVFPSLAEAYAYMNDSKVSYKHPFKIMPYNRNASEGVFAFLEDWGLHETLVAYFTDSEGVNKALVLLSDGIGSLYASIEEVGCFENAQFHTMLPIPKNDTGASLLVSRVFPTYSPKGVVLYDEVFLDAMREHYTSRLRRLSKSN